MSKEEQFVYSYSAKQQDEIKYIRDKYVKKDDRGINKIREIDRSVERKASFIGIIMGIGGVLTFGGGFSMIMTTSGGGYFILGIIIAFLGLGMSFAAYPSYPRILKRLRKRYAPLIVKMCDEALENQQK